MWFPSASLEGNLPLGMTTRSGVTCFSQKSTLGKFTLLGQSHSDKEKNECDILQPHQHAIFINTASTTKHKLESENSLTP